MTSIIRYILATCLIVGLAAAPGYADIYSWVDENGVRVFSNQSAPPGASVYLKIREPTPEERAEMEREELESIARKNREIRDDLENRLRETNRQLQNALDYADNVAQDYETRLRQAEQRAEEAIATAEPAETTIIVEQDKPRSHSGVYYVAPYYYPRYSYRHKLKHRHKPYRRHHRVHRDYNRHKSHHGVYRSPRHDRYYRGHIGTKSHVYRKPYSDHPRKYRSRLHSQRKPHRPLLQRGYGGKIRGHSHRGWR